MNRREFLQCAAILVSGAAVSQVGFSLTGEQYTYLATAPDYIARPGNYFSEAQKKAVAMLAETIIPRTETPGAIDANVPRFIELMVFEWLNDGERTLFLDGLSQLMSATPRDHGKPFEELPETERVRILEKLESQASDSSWYDFGNTRRDFISDAPFICQLKELTIWGFFTSEVGSTQVLRYEAMPMRFDGHLKLEENDSSWAGVLF